MLCFSMFCVSAGSKSNLAKAAGAVSDHFLNLGCGKIAHRCSEKRILKSKC